jgi:microcompartment protein CcmK/EutM
MIMGKVVGTVVSTHKDEGMRGFKLLVVQSLDLNMKLTSSYLIATDAVGAGMDEVVIVVQGSSARLTDQTKNRPVDAAIICIVDSVEVEGKLRYEKRFEDGKPEIQMVKTGTAQSA